MLFKLRALPVLVVVALAASLLLFTAPSASAAEPVPSPTPTGSNESHSPSCETVVVGEPTFDPPDGEVTIEMDGNPTSPGPHPGSPGEHTVVTYVNGVVIDTDSFYVAPCNAVRVPVPGYPSYTDKCNPAGVTSNIEWDGSLPEDTHYILWVEDVDTRVRTASLNTVIYPNLTWDDDSGTTPKVFSLHEDSGAMCEVPAPPKPPVVVPPVAQPIKVTGSVAKKGKCAFVAAPAMGAHYVNLKTGKVLTEGKKFKVKGKKMKVGLLAEPGYLVVSKSVWKLKKPKGC